MMRTLFSAYLWVALMYLVGAGGVVAGVYVLAGLGPALINGGAFLLAVCRFLLNGLRNG